MGSYTFRSVGSTADDIQTKALKRTVTPIGIKTPLEFGDGDGLFKMHYELASSTQDNFRNLLLTNWGERLGLYDFGANLRPLVSDWVSLEEFDSRVSEHIATAVSKWMPYITLQNYETHLISPTPSDVAVSVTVTYDVPALNIRGKQIEVRLRVM